MAKKLHLIFGLPGAGKTTLALKMVDEAKGKLVRVNKDDIRGMLGQKYNPAQEELVRSVHLAAILDALGREFDVVVDDFGLLNPKTLSCLLMYIPGDIEVIEHRQLLEVSVDKCIEQDLDRCHSVGESKIRQFADRYLPRVATEHDPTKGNCIVVDIDGCLARMAPGRDIFDWDAAMNDTVHEPIRKMINYYIKDHPDQDIQVWVLTGRSCTPSQRLMLERWLDDNNIANSGQEFILTREEGDRTPAAQFKHAHLLKIKEKWNIDFVLDDDATVIAAARSLGLQTIQPTLHP